MKHFNQKLASVTVHWTTKFVKTRERTRSISSHKIHVDNSAGILNSIELLTPLVWLLLICDSNHCLINKITSLLTYCLPLIQLNPAISTILWWQSYLFSISVVPGLSNWIFFGGLYALKYFFFTFSEISLCVIPEWV